jgi:hypothetical protein
MIAPLPRFSGPRPLRSAFACIAALSASLALANNESFWVGPGSGLAEPMRRYEGLSGAFRSSLNPYGTQWNGGIVVAMGDVNGDGVLDAIAGAGPGGGPRVRVISGQDGAALHDFFAFDQGFTGGISVAAGDLDGDGRSDLIVGTLSQSALVRAFNGANGQQMYSFFPFDQVNTDGVFVAAGDLDGDGRDDMIVGAGAGPRVSVFSGQNGTPIRSFFAYSDGYRGGVTVASGDLDGDGRSEIMTGTASGVAQVKVFSGATGGQLHSFLPFGAFRGGVRVAAGDLDGDGRSDLIAGSAVGGATVKVFNGQSMNETASFFPYGSNATQGIFLAGPGGGPRTMTNFEVNPGQVVGGQEAIGVITLSRRAPANGTFVALSSNSSAIQVPQVVKIEGGEFSGNFTVRTLTVGSTFTRQIIAEFGLRKIIKHLILTPGLRNFEVSPKTIYGGDSAQGTVYLYGPAPAGGTTVRMSSGSSAIAVMPEVTVPAGATQASFPIYTNEVGADVTRSINASLAGVNYSVNVMLLRRTKLATFTISPSTIRGGNNATGTVTTNFPARAEGFSVGISSSSTAITVPPEVIVPSGATSATFTVNTSPVGATFVRTVTATKDGITRTVNVTLTP